MYILIKYLRMKNDQSTDPSNHSFSDSSLSNEQLNQLGRTKEEQINILDEVHEQATILKGTSWEEFKAKIRNKCETEPWWKIRKIITNENRAISDMIKEFLKDENLTLKDLNVTYTTLYRITKDCLKEESKNIKKGLKRLEKENSKQRLRSMRTRPDGASVEELPEDQSRSTSNGDKLANSKFKESEISQVKLSKKALERRNSLPSREKSNPLTRRNSMPTNLKKTSPAVKM